MTEENIQSTFNFPLDYIYKNTVYPRLDPVPWLSGFK